MKVLGNEKVTDTVTTCLLSSIEQLYKAAVVLSKLNKVDRVTMSVYKQLISQIALYCEICEYVPEGLTSSALGDIYQHSSGSLDSEKLLVRDPVVTMGLRGLTGGEVDAEVLYQILFDRSYRFIPPDKRPKPDFMNPPQEG